MTPLLTSALALWIITSKVATADKTKTCGFKTIDGVIKANFSQKNTTAHSMMDCSISSCGCNLRCIGSFNKNNGTCLTAFLSPELLEWVKDLLFSDTTDKVWVSFAPASAFFSLPTPVGLWMMDSVFRGRNLGSIGQRLDSNDAGLVWTAEGPRGSTSPLKYSCFDGSATPQITNRHSGSYLLDYTKPFSIALWVKTIHTSNVDPLLSGWNSDLRKLAALFYFSSSKNEDQLFLHAKYYTKTIIDGTNRFQWRHIAVTYQAVQQNSFYLNARIWPILESRSGFLPRINPDEIFIGHNSGSNFFFKGSMACISFFDTALTQEEVRTLMNSCP